MSDAHVDGIPDPFEGGDADLDHRGMKLVRIWVPDPASPEFRAEALRQAARLKDAAEELETLEFAEAAADWPSE